MMVTIIIIIFWVEVYCIILISTEIIFIHLLDPIIFQIIFLFYQIKVKNYVENISIIMLVKIIIILEEIKIKYFNYNYINYIIIIIIIIIMY